MGRRKRGEVGEEEGGGKEGEEEEGGERGCFLSNRRKLSWKLPSAARTPPGCGERPGKKVLIISLSYFR